MPLKPPQPQQQATVVEQGRRPAPTGRPQADSPVAGDPRRPRHWANLLYEQDPTIKGSNYFGTPTPEVPPPAATDEPPAEDAPASDLGDVDAGDDGPGAGATQDPSDFSTFDGTTIDWTDPDSWPWDPDEMPWADLDLTQFDFGNFNWW